LRLLVQWSHALVEYSIPLAIPSFRQWHALLVWASRYFRECLSLFGELRWWSLRASVPLLECSRCNWRFTFLDCEFYHWGHAESELNRDKSDHRDQSLGCRAGEIAWPLKLLGIENDSGKSRKFLPGSSYVCASTRKQPLRGENRRR
jgi:hypothetical protein